VQKCLPVQQRFLAFNVILIGNTTVNRANGGALWFFVETFAFRTFSRHNVIYIVRNWGLRIFGVYRFTAWQNYFPTQCRAVFVAPVIGAFVNRSVWTLGLAGSAVNTFVGDYNCHLISVFFLGVAFGRAFGCTRCLPLSLTRYCLWFRFVFHHSTLSRIFVQNYSKKHLNKKFVMTLAEKKRAFIELGNFLRQFSTNDSLKNPAVMHNDLFFDAFEKLIQLSQSHNGWYTPEQVYFSIQSWANALTDENLTAWLSRYELTEKTPKTVALILAGNIPLVGFHDFLSVIVTGNKALVKLSSNDQHLLPFLAKYLIAVAPGLDSFITFTEGKLEHFDAVIATGSNNTSRYFEYYFKDKPGIIRKNRNSAAVLTGDETKEQLVALGEDIFRYFGLGCRNVSKLFVPKGYDFKDFFEAMYAYQDVIHYEKYANNYDYNKAVFLMSRFNLLDNGFLTIKEDSGYASPISSVFYEFYDSIDDVKTRLKADENQLQCIVSDKIDNAVPFGKTQTPELWDYADNVDTIQFLQSL
jgi:hypothetical protein